MSSDTKSHIDFKAIAADALSMAKELVEMWLPDGDKQSNEWVATNPTRPDGNPGSFKVNIKTGKWADFATGDTGGDLISLFAYLQNVSQSEAALQLKAILDENEIPETTKAEREQEQDPALFIPLPSKIPEDWSHPRLGKSKLYWTYHNHDGEAVLRIYRFDLPNGTKELIPLTYWLEQSGRSVLRWKMMPSPRVLYDLHRLMSERSKPVLICEGEKTAEAAKHLFEGCAVTTSSGGSSTPHLSDWSLLNGREVIIWPDNDPAGSEYAKAVSDLVKEAGARSISQVKVPGTFPKGWDLGDETPSGFTKSDLHSLFSAARFSRCEESNSSQGNRDRSSTEPSKFKLKHVSEFLKRPRPGWIIKDVIPRTELGMIFGEPGSGKSFFALDIACSVSLGQNWRGYKTVQGKVVYIAAEGASGVRDRIEAYRKVNEIKPEQMDLWVIDDVPNFFSGDHNGVADQIGKADLIIVDTLAQVSAGANENSGQDMGKIISACRKLHAATGAMIILVHHSGKEQGKGARGWSGLPAAVELEIWVRRTEKHFRTAKIKKLKDGPDGTVLGFSLVPVLIGSDEDGQVITSCVVRHETDAHDFRAEPSGKWQKLVISTMKELRAARVFRISLKDFCEKVAQLVPHDPGSDLGNPKRDSRRDSVERTVKDGIGSEFYVLVDGTLEHPLFA